MLGFGAMTFAQPERMGRFAHLGATTEAAASRQVGSCIDAGLTLLAPWRGT